MNPERPPRCRPLPAHIVESVAAGEPSASYPEVLDRLDEALAALPPAERAAVVAAHGYAEGRSARDGARPRDR
jgi:DNA-directed RNA polymerase specialized sigma24 family protein